MSQENGDSKVGAGEVYVADAPNLIRQLDYGRRNLGEPGFR